MAFINPHSIIRITFLYLPSQEKLEALINMARVKPEVNQVNLASCCHMPEDLVTYAKGILLTFFGGSWV